MQAGSSLGGHLGGGTTELGPTDTADAAALLDALNAAGGGDGGGRGGKAKDSNIGVTDANDRGRVQIPSPPPSALRTLTSSPVTLQRVPKNSPLGLPTSCATRGGSLFGELWGVLRRAPSPYFSFCA